MPESTHRSKELGKGSPTREIEAQARVLVISSGLCWNVDLDSTRVDREGFPRGFVEARQRLFPRTAYVLAAQAA